MTERLSDQAIHRIKSATRDLVRLSGGVVRAGEITHRSKTEVSRWQSAGDPDVIDLFAALALEADAGVPLITTVMAELNGRRLSDEAAAHSAASLYDRHSQIQQRNAQMQMLMVQVMEDLHVTPAEAELLDRSAAEQEEALRKFRSGLAAAKTSGAAATAPVPPLRAV